MPIQGSSGALAYGQVGANMMTMLMMMKKNDRAAWPNGNDWFGEKAFMVISQVPFGWPCWFS